MNRYMTIALAGTALASMASAALAQNAPPTYQADPSVYKVIFEDQNLRVIAATWKAGQTDKPHSHPVPSIAYAVTDCALKLTSPDGKSVNITPKAGSANAVPITASHTAENVGAAECRTLFVERK
jgi:quercetin dioxygenase-like cupin family protein